MLSNEGIFRLVIFLFTLSFLVLLEFRYRWRAHRHQISRITANAGLLLIGTAVLRLIIPVTAVAVASEVEGEWGVMAWFGVPTWLAIILCLLLLDMMIYWQHRLMHTVPMLWRLHRVHHTDHQLDVTTALRFHPIELILSMLLKLVAIALLGAPAIAVVLFEILLSSCALFNHANITIPKRIENRLRHVLVTPRLHRIHHSSTEVETNSNYGFSVIWWDKLFGSFTARARDGEQIHLGLKEYADEDALHLLGLLKQPIDR